MSEENKFEEFMNSGSPEKFGGIAKWIVIGVVTFSIAYGSFFTVQPEEVGVITQFGKYLKTVEPGPNFKVPFIQSVYKVAVERQQKLEFGFHTVEAGVQTEYSRTTQDKEVSVMLTGDLNLADVMWVVQYRIKDPYNYLFRVRNHQKTLEDISESCMRQVVGDNTVNEVITIRRNEIAIEVESLIQELADEYSLGVKIEQVVLQGVNPPDPVKDAFNAVNEAQQEKETLINQAKSKYNKVIPRATGEAEETIQKAVGYSTERVNQAKGDSARFVDLYKEYVKAPSVYKQRVYLETMGRVIPKLGKKIVTDEKGSNVLPLLNMDFNQVK